VFGDVVVTEYDESVESGVTKWLRSWKS